MSRPLELSPVQERTAKPGAYAALLLRALMPGSQGVIEYFPPEGNNADRVQEALTHGWLTALLGITTTYVPVLNAARNYVVEEARVLQRAGTGSLPSELVMHDLAANMPKMPTEYKGNPALERYWESRLPARAYDITNRMQLALEPCLASYAALGQPAIDPLQPVSLVGAAPKQLEESPVPVLAR